LNRSQRILIVIGVVAVAALASPYITRAIVDREGVAGKTIAFQGQTPRPGKDLVLCMIDRRGTLNLKVASNDLYTDPASGLAVRVDEHVQYREVFVFLPPGKALAAPQLAQLQGCLKG
jgi:hypothetical protein